MKKKIIGLLTAASMLAACVPSFAAEDNTEFATREYVVSEFVQSVGRNNLDGSAYMLSTFKDSNEISDEYVNDFEKAVSNGLIRGYDDDTLKPKQSITRVEALMILARCIPETDDLDAEPIKFTDVPDWAEQSIDGLSKLGIVYGYGDGRLGAQDNITVEQVKLLTERSDEYLNTVPVGESFYGHVNNKVFRNAQLSSASIIDAKHGAVISAVDAWSYMNDMQMNISNRETELLTKLMNGELEYEKGSPEQRIHDLLLCIQNASNLTDEDEEYIRRLRSSIIDAKTLEELIEVTDKITQETGISTLYDVTLMQDPDTNIPYPYISISSPGSGGIINFRKCTRDAFSGMYEEALKDAMASVGLEVSDEDVKKATEIQAAASLSSDCIVALSMGFALRQATDPSLTAEMVQAEMKKLTDEHPELDPDTMTANTPDYQKYDEAAANGLFPKIRLADALKAIGFKKTDTVYSNSEETCDKLNKLITDDDLNALKINALLNLSNIGCYLNDDEKTAFSNVDNINAAAASFVEGDSAPTWESIRQNADKIISIGQPAGEAETADDNDILSMKNLTELRDLLPIDISLMYCDYYYDDKISDEIVDMVSEIWDEYIETFKKNTWMSEETKQNAIDKIKNMIAVIGYPDNYNFPEIVSPEDGGTLFKNRLNVKTDALNTVIRSCDEAIFTRVQMVGTPDVVNAMYVPSLNVMNIFAGILQYPFYDQNASRAQNLGAIGAIIGHEIGHAFDTTGSQYDRNGCLKNWWTEKDLEEYNKRVDKFIEYYKNFSVIDGVVQDSSVTITENMADFAGLRCVLNILEGDKEAQKEALESWARAWARLGTEKYVTSSSIMTDVHSANNVRVDGVVASMDEFYEIYDVKEGDPMYIAPEDRLNLW